MANIKRKWRMADISSVVARSRTFGLAGISPMGEKFSTDRRLFASAASFILIKVRMLLGTSRAPLHSFPPSETISSDDEAEDERSLGLLFFEGFLIYVSCSIFVRTRTTGPEAPAAAGRLEVSCNRDRSGIPGGLARLAQPGPAMKKGMFLACP